MAIGSYAACSVTALQIEDLMSVRGHIIPANLIHAYMVGPMKKKPNMPNLQHQINECHQGQLAIEEPVEMHAIPPETLHPVVRLECPPLDQGLLDEGAAGPEGAVWYHAPDDSVFVCKIHKITKHIRSHHHRMLIAVKSAGREIAV